MRRFHENNWIISDYLSIYIVSLECHQQGPKQHAKGEKGKTWKTPEHSVRSGRIGHIHPNQQLHPQGKHSWAQGCKVLGTRLDSGMQQVRYTGYLKSCPSEEKPGFLAIYQPLQWHLYLTNSWRITGYFTTLKRGYYKSIVSLPKWIKKNKVWYSNKDLLRF